MKKTNRNLIFIVAGLMLTILLGYAFYYKVYIKPYIYWYQLMEKDPRPLNIPIEDYQLKNKQGFCWREQKYYSKSELQQKAMLSFVEDVLLAKLKFYRTGKVLDANDHPFGNDYVRGCKENDINCRLWLIPKKYKTEEVVGLIKLNRKIYREILSTNNKYEINSASDFSKIKFNNTENSSILMSVQIGAADLYPSNCCAIKTYQEVLSSVEENNLATGGSSNNPYEAFIPPEINIQEHGVGNYFLQTTMINHNVDSQYDSYYYTQKPTYTYFLNNCGDVLFKPFYWR